MFYIRSIDQESLNLQKLKGEKYAEQNSLLFNFIVNEKTSGLSPFSERPGMHKVLQMVEERKIKTVIVYSLIRVSRDTEQLLYFIEFLNKYHTRLVILNGDFKNAY